MGNASPQHMNGVAKAPELQSDQDFINTLRHAAEGTMVQLEGGSPNPSHHCRATPAAAAEAAPERSPVHVPCEAGSNSPIAPPPSSLPLPPSPLFSPDEIEGRRSRYVRWLHAQHLSWHAQFCACDNALRG